MNYYRVQQNQNDKNDEVSNNNLSMERNNHAQEKILKTN